MAALKTIDTLISMIEENKENEEKEEEDNDNPYNADSIVNLYIHFHYCDDKYFEVENYPKAVAKIAIDCTNKDKRNRVLDLGCATGRTSFELAKEFKQVTGIDYAQRLINVGLQFKKNKYLEWTVCNHGDIMDKFNCSIKDFGLTQDILDRIEFAKGDAHKLKYQYKDYDCIVACNLIDRLHSPLLFLENIDKIMTNNGILIILDPYTWLEQYTNKNKWIGAKVIDNKPISTFDALKKILSIKFQFIKEQNVPFVIRETARKYQHTLSHCTVWKKK